MGCTGEASVRSVGDEKMNVIFIIGGPGSGKGTQCKKLKDALNIEYLSTGDIIRKAIKDETENAKQLKTTLELGELIPTKTLFDIMKPYLREMTSRTVLLSGFPRNQENIDEWNKEMNKFAELKAVIYFECSEVEMTKRCKAKNGGDGEDVKRKIEIFNKETLPLVDLYRNCGLLIEVNSLRSIDDVFNDVRSQLEERQVLIA